MMNTISYIIRQKIFFKNSSFHIRSNNIKLSLKNVNRTVTRYKTNCISNKQLIEEDERINIQGFDYTTLEGIIYDIQQWIPSRIEQVIQWNKCCIALRIRNMESETWLHLSWHPKSARICLGNKPRRGDVSEVFSFGENLHKYLNGLILKEIECPIKYERIACLKFSDGVDREIKYSLFCEIMSSNLILVDNNGNCSQCAHQVGDKNSRIRQLQHNTRYVIPPVQNGIEPNENMKYEEWIGILNDSYKLLLENKKECKMCDVITRGFQGISPLLSQDLLRLSNININILFDKMTNIQLEMLYDNWKMWLIDIIDNKKFKPTLCSKRNKYSLLGTFDKVYDDISKLIYEYYTNFELKEDFNILTTHIETLLKKSINKYQNKYDNLNKTLLDSNKADMIQKKADMIMAYLHNYKEGTSELEVEDWESGKKRVLKLERGKTALETAETLYKKAKKMKRANFKIIPIMESCDKDIIYLNEVEESIQELKLNPTEADLHALKEIQEDLINGGYIAETSEHHLIEKARKKADKQLKNYKISNNDESISMRMFTSENGYRILCGRNSRQNDILSIKIAKSGDHWFHASGVPGSHVILKMDGKNVEPKDIDLNFAASIAAYYSKARNDNKVDVSYTLAQHVKKPKGAKLGTVTLSNYQTLIVKPFDPSTIDVKD